MLARTLLVCTAALILIPNALADGGPGPPVLVGYAGVANTSGTVRYVATQAGGFTTLEAIQTDGGQVINSTSIPGAWGIPLVDYTGTAGGLSADGRTLVLAPSGYGGVCRKGVCTALRSATTFQVFTPTTLRRRTAVTLRGDFSFDALSPDGRRLYLIQHSSSFNLNEYRVRAFDLRLHKLLPGAIADRAQRGWIMQGVPMARATSSDGRYVYTLYANSGGYPFVHALDSVAGTAHCIGVPWTHEQTVGDLDVLQLSGNGRTLEIGGATSPAARRMYFLLDTRSYRVSPVTAHDAFPWWTLGLLVLLAPVPVVLARRRMRRAFVRDRPTIEAALHNA